MTIRDCAEWAQHIPATFYYMIILTTFLSPCTMTAAVVISFCRLWLLNGGVCCVTDRSVVCYPHHSFIRCYYRILPCGQ